MKLILSGILVLFLYKFTKELIDTDDTKIIIQSFIESILVIVIMIVVWSLL